MSEELVALTNIGDTIRDKIKQVLLDSIPKETLDAMIKKEFDDFFNGKAYGSSWNSGRHEPEFKGLVSKAMTEIMGKQIRDYIGNKLALSQDDMQASMDKLIVDLTPAVLAAAQAAQARTVIETIVNQLGYVRAPLPGQGG